MPKQRANIRDVARESGVSLTTVSLVLNNNDARISEATRQRVLLAMDKLDYTPSRLARGLPNRQAKTLAILVPALRRAFADFYFGETISGAYEAAARRGYRLLLEVARPEFIKRRRHHQLLEDCSVDGILFIGATDEHRWLAEFDDLDRPLLVVNNHFESWRLHHVACDYPEAGRLAADALAGQGHRRIAHICGPLAVVRTSREVSDAFADQLAEHGVHLSDQLVLDGDFQVETGKLACDELLARDPGLTAIFCSNDKMALGAYQSLRQHGRRPGEDVAVVGCDDIPAATLADPPLTTVRMHFFRVGARACERLLEHIEDKDRDRDLRIAERVPVELVTRSSCCSTERSAQPQP